MKLTVPILLLVAVGHAAKVKLPSRSEDQEELEEFETAKRDLIEGNYGLRTTASFIDNDGQSVNGGIEYADSNPELNDKSPLQELYARPVPRIPKISDVLSGQGLPFHSAINSHLYSPVSIYQPRLGSPTTYEVPPPISSEIDYPEHQEITQYKQIPQSVQISKQTSFPRVSPPEHTTFFTQTSSQNSFDPKPIFSNLKTSHHPSFPRFESPEQFLPNFRQESFPVWNTGKYNDSSPETSDLIRSRSKSEQVIPFRHSSVPLDRQRQQSLPRLEYPQGLIEAGFTPYQFYQLINHLENQHELYTEVKPARYPTGTIHVPVDYLQAPASRITYAPQESEERSPQQEHERTTPPDTKVSEVQISATKQNSHPNGAVSYARFSQSLPGRYYTQNRPVQPLFQQQELPLPQLQPTPPPLLQSTPLGPQLTNQQQTTTQPLHEEQTQQSSVEIPTKHSTTLQPQYITTIQEITSPADTKVTTLLHPVVTTQKEKFLTKYDPLLPTQRPQMLTTLQTQIQIESPALTTAQEEYLSTSQPQQQPQATKTQSLTSLQPYSSSTAQPILQLQPESSPGIHPLPYLFKHQSIQQMQPQQLYKPLPQSYQKPQQSQQPPPPSSQSYQPQQQPYQPPQLKLQSEQHQPPQKESESLQQSQYFGNQVPEKSSFTHGSQEEYYNEDAALSPLLQAPIYTGADELLLPEPRFHSPIVVPPPAIQYYGKFAESIFGGTH